MERLQRTTVNDARNRVATARVEIQVITTNFLTESEEQESPEDQAYTKLHGCIPNLFDLEPRSLRLRSTATMTKISLNTKARDERTFQVICGL